MGKRKKSARASQRPDEEMRHRPTTRAGKIARVFARRRQWPTDARCQLQKNQSAYPSRAGPAKQRCANMSTTPSQTTTAAARTHDASKGRRTRSLTNLPEVTRMVLIKEDPMVMLSTSVTATASCEGARENRSAKLVLGLTSFVAFVARGIEIASSPLVSKITYGAFGACRHGHDQRRRVRASYGSCAGGSA